MELKIEKYIRTSYGVGRIINELHDCWWLDKKIMFNSSNGELEDILIKDSVDHLKQIKLCVDNEFDLICTGDFVNGKKIRDIEEEVLYITGDVIYKHEIVDLVTKEAFNELRYRFNEDE